MFEELLAHEHYLNYEREIERQRIVQLAQADQRRQRKPGTPMRARLGRWLMESGQRLIEGA
jgi:hypothetical protein